MAGALFARIKTWVAETLNFADLNAEFQNLLDKFGPQWMDDYSASVAQMQSTTDPGSTGSESQATSLSGELERLRFQLKAIIGSDVTNWYDAPPASLSELDDTLALPSNRIVSGRIRSATDTQPIFLVPGNSTNKVTLKGASTSFVYYVAGTQYTISSDVDLTGLSQAPSTNNTALVNDTAIADGVETRIIGENGSTLPIDTAGSEITSLVGTYQAFKINDGTNDEYFYAFVESSTALTKIRRGFYFDSADAPIPRLKIANNDTITLMKIAYIFAKTDGTLTSTGNLPIVAYTQPAGPSNGDYWFDIANDIWKVYNGSTFADSTATYIGHAVTAATNTIAARSNEFYAAYNTLNTVVPTKIDSATVRSLHTSGQISVRGITYRFEPNKVEWSMGSHLDDGDAYSGSEQASTLYHLYIDDLGDVHISDIEPYDRAEDLHGKYHPYHSWRFLAYVNNDASSNLEDVQLVRVTTDGTNPGARGISKSASSGVVNTTSTSYVDVTNLSATISTRGYPVEIKFVSADPSGGDTGTVKCSALGGNSFGFMQILRDSTAVASWLSGCADTSSANQNARDILAGISHIDFAPAGTYTYKVQYKAFSGATIEVERVHIMLRELYRD